MDSSNQDILFTVCIMACVVGALVMSVLGVVRVFVGLYCDVLDMYCPVEPRLVPHVSALTHRILGLVSYKLSCGRDECFSRLELICSWTLGAVF
jgi:hypothetical protein